MNQLNSLIIEGNVVRNPDYREPSKGFKVCTVPLAVNRFYKNKNGEGINEVSYFNVETFGKMAEICANECEKGRGMRIVGRLKQDRWKNADGKTSSKISIIAEHIEFKRKFTRNESQENLAAIAEANKASVEEEILLEPDEVERGEENSFEEESVY